MYEPAEREPQAGVNLPPWEVAALATDEAWLDAAEALFAAVDEPAVADPEDPYLLAHGYGTLSGPAPTNLEALAERGYADAFLLAELDRAAGPHGDLSGLDEYDLLEMAALWRRLESRCAGAVRATAAELASRVPMTMAKPAVMDRRTNFRTSFAADELAPRLGVSKREANRLINVGKLQTTIAGPTGSALEAGHIDPTKADLIATAVAVLDAEPALEVQEEILPKAPGWTTYRLRKEIATAVATADPAHFTQRAKVASTKRYVSRARMVADGMATQSLYWPAADALTLDLALDAAAATARAAGDPRTLEQLRPDILADLVAHHLASGQIGPHEAAPAVAGAGAPTDVADGGAAPDGAGGGAATSSDLVPATPDDTEPALQDPAPTPDCDPEPRSAPAFVREPQPGDPNLAVPADRGQPRIWPIGILGGHKAQILVHVPLSTLLGGDEPGIIEGLGPVPADVAMAVAAGGDLTRLVTDPVTDRIIDYGTTKYRPPQNMIDRVKANEPHCVGPGCSASARQTELNHRVPYPIGPTSDDNLDPLCRRDHVLVTHGAFSYERAPDGTITWHTPTGHTYQRTPDGTITQLHRDLNHPAHEGKTRYRTPAPPPDPDEEPPF